MCKTYTESVLDVVVQNDIPESVAEQIVYLQHQIDRMIRLSNKDPYIEFFAVYNEALEDELEVLGYDDGASLIH